MKSQIKKCIFSLSAYVLVVNVALAEEQSTQANSIESKIQPKLEVIEVTAQKRQENAQDTPISLSVVNAGDLKEKSIEKIDYLQYVIPNLQMTETGISTQVFMVGIFSGPLSLYR